jgi:hypothetical protein
MAVWSRIRASDGGEVLWVEGQHVSFNPAHVVSVSCRSFD